MQRNLSLVILLGSLFVIPACGDDGDDGNGGVDASTVDSPTSDAFTEDGFTTLIARDWTVPAGRELYRCTRVTLDRTVYLSGFRAIDPLGTHHAVLAVNPTPLGQDGDYNCSAAALGHSMLFAAGVGTDDLEFPGGVALKIEAGQQLDLNLHLYNLSDSPISGSSGVMTKFITEAEVQQEAEVVFGGAELFAIGANPIEQTISGGCAFTQSATVVALWPHMHQIGHRMRAVHRTAAGATTTIFDELFDFNEQHNYILPQPVQVAAGDRFDIDCVYRNTTGNIVFYGDSSESEMCYLGIYRYPATGANLFACVE